MDSGRSGDAWRVASLLQIKAIGESVCFHLKARSRASAVCGVSSHAIAEDRLQPDHFAMQAKGMRNTNPFSVCRS